MLSRILVPLDGSALAEAIIPQVVELAALRKGEVLLLRVALAHANPGLDPVEAQVRAIEEAQAYLEGIETRLAAQGLSVKCCSYGPRPRCQPRRTWRRRPARIPSLPWMHRPPSTSATSSARWTFHRLRWG